ncbi:hypothetical protein [Flavobacterium selenitireducens]|uniref:hypothetical protein n=1 Tax=Flavobacterium selenitireducens TaxID=2722704 RepID=UPI00168B970F|nr:hypothetical protein [Flavobacterium selenitireducens]MBD3584056.1 hypothetical protein [Flavobacterium selenitireducens]
MALVIIIGLLILAVYAFKVAGKSKHELEQKGNPIHIGLKNSEEFLSANINKAKKFAQKTVTKSYLTGCTWMLINNTDEKNILFTFRLNNELLITIDGIVEKGNYELIVDNNSILLTRGNITEHYNIVNVQDDFIFLNKMSSQKVLAFANQTKFKDEIKFMINQKAKQYYQFESERFIN